MSRRRSLAVLVAALTALAVAATPATARDDEIRRSGSCSGPSDWRLRVRKEDARRLQVRFEIEHGASGQTWEVFLSDNGTRFFAGTRTSGDNGYLRVRKQTKNRAGTDRIKGFGYDRTTGETCSGKLVYDR
jgi:hypothetical protein